MIQIQPDQSELKKQRHLRIHKIFFYFDTLLAGFCFIISLVLIPDWCSVGFFFYYSFFYAGQSIQHRLFGIIPKIDIVKHDKIIKRYLGIAIISLASYFFLVFMFWTGSKIHPLYCFLCLNIGFPLAIGLVIVIHFIISLLLFVQLLHNYISRKYYLIALGGFDVQVRIKQQREESLRRVALLQPYYNDYPVSNDHPAPNKYYQFQDIIEDVKGEMVCSICLMKDKEGGHPIYTTCKHYFHRECIEDWTKINSRCPECRTEFKQITFQQFAQLESQQPK